MNPYDEAEKANRMGAEAYMDLKGVAARQEMVYMQLCTKLAMRAAVHGIRSLSPEEYDRLMRYPGFRFEDYVTVVETKRG